ncbi:cleavage and polyadenylation specifity factor protein, partial [Cystoisospora suis]
MESEKGSSISSSSSSSFSGRLPVNGNSSSSRNTLPGEELSSSSSSFSLPSASILPRENSLLSSSSSSSSSSCSQKSSSSSSLPASHIFPDTPAEDPSQLPSLIPSLFSSSSSSSSCHDSVSSSSSSSEPSIHISAFSKRRRVLLGEDSVDIIPLGAGCEVGRSCIVVKYKGKTIMFDCGVHPAYNGLGALPIFDAVDTAQVDVCLVTHFHLDHCGALPYLVTKTPFRGRIFMTEPTRVICKLLWIDYARMNAFSSSSRGGSNSTAPSHAASSSPPNQIITSLMDIGVQGAGRMQGDRNLLSSAGGGLEAGASSSSSVNGLYTEEDVDLTVQKIECLDFRQQIEIGGGGIKVSSYSAGHVLGACMFLVEIGGVRILYTGDFSREKDRHVPIAEIPPQIDVQLLICESTYGIHIHDDRELRERRFIKSILDIVVGRGGKCLLPVFALGRAQELLLILEEYWSRHPEVQHIPIIFLSPLSSKCLVVFDTFIDMCGEPVKERALRGENPFMFRYVKNIKNIDSARVYIHHDNPAVIFASPGMLQSGVSRDIFQTLAPDEKNGVILTGYTVKGTPADDLKREPELIQFPDRVIRRRCSFDMISFSAHSDYQQTEAFITELQVPNVVLVHGERGEMRRLKEKLEQERPALSVFAPEILQKVSLQFTSANTCVVAGGKLADDLQRTTLKRDAKTSCRSLETPRGNGLSSSSSSSPLSALPEKAGGGGVEMGEKKMRGRGKGREEERKCGRQDKEKSHSMLGGEEKIVEEMERKEKQKAGETESEIEKQKKERREGEDDAEGLVDGEEEEEKEEEEFEVVDGVVVCHEGRHPLLVYPEDLTSVAHVPVTRLQQRLRLPYIRPLSTLYKAASQIYEDITLIQDTEDEDTAEEREEEEEEEEKEKDVNSADERRSIAGDREEEEERWAKETSQGEKRSGLRGKEEGKIGEDGQNEEEKEIEKKKKKKEKSSTRMKNENDAYHEEEEPEEMLLSCMDTQSEATIIDVLLSHLNQQYGNVELLPLVPPSSFARKKEDRTSGFSPLSLSTENEKDLELSMKGAPAACSKKQTDVRHTAQEDEKKE